jgi:hypothetical protein
MARNKKKRGTIAAAATAVTQTVTKAAKATVKAVEKHVVAPVAKVVRGPTPKKVKVKRPKYVRPPRTPAKPKPAAAEAEKPESKGLSHAARTLRHSVAKSIPKAGVDMPDRPGPGPK